MPGRSQHAPTHEHSDLRYPPADQGRRAAAQRLESALPDRSLLGLSAARRLSVAAAIGGLLWLLCLWAIA
jgi:hypothetical protein